MSESTLQDLQREIAEMSARRWVTRGYSRHHFVNGAGRILGTVMESFNGCFAYYGNRSLGQFVDVDSAKRAVERADGAR